MSLDAAEARKRARRPLLVSLILALAVGAAASLFSAPALPGWYAGLAKPAFAPPGWLLPPLWTALYILLGVAAFRAHRARTGPRDPALVAYGLLLALALGWSALLFGLHAIALAFVESMLLALAALAAGLLFWRRDRLAGLLLLAYLAWAIFAALLCWRLWQHNP